MVQPLSYRGSAGHLTTVATATSIPYKVHLNVSVLVAMAVSMTAVAVATFHFYEELCVVGWFVCCG